MGSTARFGAAWGGLGGSIRQVVADAAAEEKGEYVVVGGDKDVVGVQANERIPHGCPVAAVLAFALADRDTVFLGVIDS